MSIYITSDNPVTYRYNDRVCFTFYPFFGPVSDPSINLAVRWHRAVVALEGIIIKCIECTDDWALL